MRFVLSFIFFGLLFYAMYLYVPDTFHTLVSWAAKIFDFAHQEYEKFMQYMTTPQPPSVPTPKGA